MGSRWKVCEGEGLFRVVRVVHPEAKCETEDPHASERTVFICFSRVPKIFAGHRGRDEIVAGLRTEHPTT